jgi:dGTPase
MEHQRELMAELFEALWSLGADGLDPSFVEDWQVAGDDNARRRVIVDQVASYTDARAINRHAELVPGGR